MEPLHFEELEHGEELTLEQLGLMIGKEFAHNDKRFDAIEARLGKIENLLMEEQKRDIAEVKVRVKRLEGALAV